MSTLNNPQEIPESVKEWLDDLQQERASRPQPRKRFRRRQPPEMPQSELQQRAAQCYAMAGWGEDACRMFEILGDRRHAAPYYERRGLWLAAADCYRSVGEWQNAARCYRQGEHYDEAAECLVKAEQPIQAAWIWADLAHLYQRAEYTVRQIETTETTELLAIELILARCEVGTGTPGAGRRIRTVIEGLAELPLDFRAQELKQWAFAVASELQRPDMTVMLYAMGVEAKHPGAATQWEEWIKTKTETRKMLMTTEKIE